MLHKLDVGLLQSLDSGHHHHHHHHRCDDDHLGHLCEEHGVLVVDIVIGHPVVQHPSLVSQTLNPEQDHHHGEDWEEELLSDENVVTVVVM